MECKIELIFIPVTDVDKAIDFYVNKVGFTLDMQARVDEHTRFVQVTPPTSACSIAFGEGITDMTPGTQNSIQVVVTDAEAARRELIERGVDAPGVKTLAWGSFTSFSDPDGNTWTLQQLPPPGSYDAPRPDSSQRRIDFEPLGGVRVEDPPSEFGCLADRRVKSRARGSVYSSRTVTPVTGCRP